MRRLAGMVTVLLITVKLASPFLHTEDHQTVSTYSTSHCAACDYEAAQAVEPGLVVLLPVQQFSYEIKIYPVTEDVAGSNIPPSESRGPPQNS